MNESTKIHQDLETSFSLSIFNPLAGKHRSFILPQVQYPQISRPLILDHLYSSRQKHQHTVNLDV